MKTIEEHIEKDQAILMIQLLVLLLADITKRVTRTRSISHHHPEDHRSTHSNYL